MPTKFKNWKCYSYRFSHNKRKDYGYNELKDYFFIDGSEVIYCKKDFGECKEGNYYLVSDGTWYGGWGKNKSGFIVIDWNPYSGWEGKEYMRSQ